ncbi:MAG: ABC transporter permease [Chloroflexi bacterium]|nr:ABC transporter permease [Chloroflexota bacterium]
MRTYVIKRLLLMFPTIFGVALITFMLLRLVPGDVLFLRMQEAAYFSKADLDALRVSMGLDKPVIVQFFMWLGDLFRGDLGYSYYTDGAVLPELMRRLPLTIELALLTIVLSVSLSLVIGVLAAIRQDTILDYTIRSFSILGLAMPVFWVGIMVVIIAANVFGWSPPIFYKAPWEDPVANLQKLILPALVLAWSSSAGEARLVRSSVLEVLRQDYVRTAYAKGLSERMVLMRHVLKNSLIPAVTAYGGRFGALLGGTVVMEIVFSLPGAGRLTVQSVQARDYPQVQASILFIAMIYVSVNLAVDLLYGWLDPRIRYQ